MFEEKNKIYHLNVKLKEKQDELKNLLYELDKKNLKEVVRLHALRDRKSIEDEISLLEKKVEDLEAKLKALEKEYKTLTKGKKDHES